MMAGNFCTMKVSLFRKLTPDSMLVCSIVIIVIITMIEKIPTTTPRIVRKARSRLVLSDWRDMKNI
jgi:hypothetical protein